MKWPGVRVVGGDAVGGLGPGAVLAVEMGLWHWRTRRESRVPYWVGAIDIGAEAESFDDADAADAGADAGRDPVAFAADADGWRSREQTVPLSQGSLLDTGPWRIELVDDVGALPSLRRMGAVVLARPAGFQRNALGEPGVVWLLVNEPTSCLVLWDSGRVQKIPRWTGTPLPQRNHTVLDVERAKALALAVPSSGASSSVALSFDGAVTWKESGRRRGSALEQFCRLIGRPLVHERDRDDAAAEFAAVEAASVDDVAALARSIDPVGWAREAELREECAIAALSAPSWAGR